jgi:hypothetical protein
MQLTKEMKPIKSKLELPTVTKTKEQLKMIREKKETDKRAFLAIEKHWTATFPQHHLIKN